MSEQAGKVSATIITLNEEKNIAACIESVSWADEVVVLDSRSTDRTVEIARRYTDKVFVEEWKGQGAHKNRAVGLAQGPWIFSIDADERATPELAAEIRRVLKAPEYHAYSVRRKNFYRGQWIKHGGWWPDWVTRLFRKDSASFNDRVVHESVETHGAVGRLAAPLIHESYSSVADFLERVQRYAVLGSRQMYAAGRRAGACAAFCHAAFAFLKGYALRAGFLDGAAGLLIAASNAAGAFYRYMLLRELAEDEKAGLKPGQ